MHMPSPQLDMPEDLADTLPLSAQQYSVEDIPDNYWDVAVIGAGPAGATAALLLARQGYSVLLLDKHRFPLSSFV